MVSFTLPKIKAADSIVDGAGKPTIKFLKFFNFDFARAIEKNDASQSAIIEELSAQLLLIQQAQATADAAQATANNNAGSKIADLISSPGGASATQTVGNVPDLPYVELTGSLRGGSLDADASWLGEATLTEDNGATAHVIAVIPITVTSSGEILPGPAWRANDSSEIVFSGFADYSGTVTYTLSVIRTGGSNYVDGAAIDALLRITPGVA